MAKNKTLILFNLIAFVTMVYLNYLSNALPINGHTPGELSDKYVNYFVPAGLTFSIWGVIYGWFLVFIVAQIIAYFNKPIFSKIEPIIQKIGWLFVVTCILNIAWLLAWHYELVAVSVLIMLSFLVTLIYIFVKIGVGQTKVNTQEKWLSHAPFSIYLGWISIATIANITALLVQNNWSGIGFDGATWAKIMIAVGFLVCLFMVISKKAVFFGLVVLWAFYGIYIKRLGLQDATSLSIANFASYFLGAIPVIILLKIKAWLAY
jgi:translocator protein